MGDLIWLRVAMAICVWVCLDGFGCYSSRRVGFGFGCAF